ncbi:DUF1622 domain-containing protein [Desulfonatronovibrio hydrogenovorans]|uniref:DUF1622 domain-containing protein n=1 Tax=Desulfonatronovibrio hydrogenovorans TaxID=53245 RepID=UPI001FC9B91E|nr:DUF1622 domain-containing protein [Desulfonatronovibrio hydrogenovorans]
MFQLSDGLFKTSMYYAAMSLEILGVTVICAGVVATTGLFLYRAWIYRDMNRFYGKYRKGMGKAILLGLELLVAGDIIMTTTHGFELHHLTVLGILVLIRTFLSFSLEIEINGHLPWKRPPEAEKD